MHNEFSIFLFSIFTSGTLLHQHYDRAKYKFGECEVFTSGMQHIILYWDASPLPSEFGARDVAN